MSAPFLYPGNQDASDAPTGTQGGYSPSQVGTPHDGKGATDHQTMVPVTCKQVHDVEKLSGADMFKIGGKLVYKVCLVVRLNGWRTTGREVILSVTDGTGTLNVTIFGMTFSEELKAWTEEPAVSRDRMLRVYGHIRTYHKETCVIGFHCQFIGVESAVAQMFHHYHSAVFTSLYYKHGALDDIKKEGGQGQGQVQGQGQGQGQAGGPAPAAHNGHPAQHQQPAGGAVQQNWQMNQASDVKTRSDMMKNVIRSTPQGTMHKTELKRTMSSITGFPDHEFSHTLNALIQSRECTLDNDVVRLI